MTAKEKIREVVSSDESFKLYVAEHIGSLSANVDHLVAQSATQFRRLDEIERKASACETKVDRIEKKGCGNHPLELKPSQIRPAFAASAWATVALAILEMARQLTTGRHP